MAIFLRLLICSFQIWLYVSLIFTSHTENATYHRHRHGNDDQIRNYVCECEYRQHRKCIRAQSQERPDRRPIQVPDDPALEYSRKEEGETPCDDDTDHDPAPYRKPADGTEDAFPEQEDGDLDEAKGDLLGGLDAVFDLFAMLHQPLSLLQQRCAIGSKCIC